MPAEDFSPAVPVTSLSPPCFSDPDVVAQPLSAIARNAVPYASTRFDCFMGVPPQYCPVPEKCRVTYIPEESKDRVTGPSAVASGGTGDRCPAKVPARPARP